MGDWGWRMLAAEPDPGLKAAPTRASFRDLKVPAPSGAGIGSGSGAEVGIGNCDWWLKHVEEARDHLAGFALHYVGEGACVQRRLRAHVDRTGFVLPCPVDEVGRRIHGA